MSNRERAIRRLFDEYREEFAGELTDAEIVDHVATKHGIAPRTVWVLVAARVRRRERAH